MLSDWLWLPALLHIVCVVLRCCRAAVAVREEVHEVLPGTVPAGGPGGGARLLTLEQLAAMDRASGGAAGSRGADKPHKAKVGAMDVCVFVRGAGTCACTCACAPAGGLLPHQGVKEQLQYARCWFCYTIGSQPGQLHAVLLVHAVPD